jgi:hypothetical protein
VNLWDLAITVQIAKAYIQNAVQFVGGSLMRKRNDHGARCSVNSAKSPTPPPLQEKEARTTARGRKTTAPKSYY